MADIPRIEVEALLNDKDFVNAANRIQVSMDRMDTLSEKLGVSKSALTTALKNENQQVQENSFSWTEFRSMYSTVLDVVKVGQQVWDATAEKYIENALAVDDMARSMGAAPEEASRLKEVADDLGLSMSTLKVAMREAIKDGSAPTIETLARMSDEYLALAPGVDRAQYLTDKFGKSGAQMGRLMEIGSDGIKKMSSSIDENLIVTEQAIEKAKRYKMAQDGINDAWTAFTYEVAPKFIDAATTLLNNYNDHARALEIMEEKGLSTYHAMEQVGYLAAMNQATAEREAAEATRMAASAAGDATGEFESQADAEKRLADEAKVAKEALDQMTESNRGQLGLIMDLQNETRSYNERLAETTQKYGENSQQVLQLQADHEQAMKKIYADLYVAMLQADGFTEAEFNAALEAYKSAGVIDQATIDMGKSWYGAAQSAANAVTEADNLTTAVNNIPTEKTVTITTVYNSVGNAGQIGGVDNPGMGGYATGTGGWLTVPQGFPNDSYKIGLTSGEKFNVVPSAQAQSDGIDYDRLANAVAGAMAANNEELSSVFVRVFESKFQQALQR